MEISIIIPCYNEEDNIPTLTKKISLLKKKFQSFEIIMVDNGSTDKTLKILQNNNLNNQYKIIIVKKNKGYGFGIKQGLINATKDYVGWIHADNLNSLIFFDEIEEMKILMSDNIFIKGLRNEKRQISEYFFTFFLSFFSSIVLRCKLNDINAQPTIFNKRLLKKMNNIPDDFTIDLYVLYFAKKNQQLIKRINVFNEKRIHGESSWNRGLFSKVKLSLQYINYVLFKIKL